MLEAVLWRLAGSGPLAAVADFIRAGGPVLLLVGAAGLFEGAAQALQILRRDADAGVGDDQGRVVRAGLGVQAGIHGACRLP